MSPQERLTAALNRIAVTPNIIRTRREDAVRAERMVDDFDRVIDAAAAGFEKFAEQLEKALA
jgi:hypothetical protein